jgi:hypothetical protein
VAHDKNRWRVFIKTGIRVRVPKTAGNFFKAEVLFVSAA